MPHKLLRSPWQPDQACPPHSQLTNQVPPYREHVTWQPLHLEAVNTPGYVINLNMSAGLEIEY